MMSKKRGNPNWGKLQMGVPAAVVEFERAVREFKLRPEQYAESSRLREWASHNMGSKYIPESLLKAWGFEIKSVF